jgi:arylsulfatase A-like enzyme
MTNIALVVLDTLRKDRFDRYFDWLPGLRFENAYSTANWTGPAHASIFTGRYGSEIGISSKSRAFDCRMSSIVEELADCGYTTRGWSANPNVSRTQGYDRGFEHFSGPLYMQYPNKNLLDFEHVLAEHGDSPAYKRYLLAARECISGDCDTANSLVHGYRSIRGIEEPGSVIDDGASTALRNAQETKFGDEEFLFVNLMEAHTPYFPPAEHREFDEPITTAFGDAYLGVDDPDAVRAGYESAVQYLAHIYKQIYEELVDNFEYIITISDHGELLGEHHGMWNHVSGIYPELVHVPVVISGPGLAGSVESTVSLLDVHRTIASLAELTVSSRGQDLLSDDVQSRQYIAEYRGPFAESLAKAREDGIELGEYDRNLFAFAESSNYYGYEDYDGWHETGTSSVANPQEYLHHLIERYEMAEVEVTDSYLADEAMNRLADLGYL